MYDAFNRKINYLRISVTDRCNLRCTYCMPSGPIQWMEKKALLSPSEIEKVVTTAAEKGITKIRLTGGEPLLRTDIIEIIQRINSIPLIQEIGMTTNGHLLTKYAPLLKKAGLSRVNISLDTLDPTKYKKITGADIKNALEGIDAALKSGLTPVKINVVKMKGINDDETTTLKQFAKNKNLKIRFIRKMNLKSGEFYPIEGGQGGICSICNRLRITANGLIKPCLYSDLAYSIKHFGPEEALNEAIKNKPEKGILSKSHDFFNIGG